MKFKNYSIGTHVYIVNQLTPDGKRVCIEEGYIETFIIEDGFRYRVKVKLPNDRAFEVPLEKIFFTFNDAIKNAIAKERMI